MAQELRLNTFQMCAPVHNWAGLWRLPGDQAVDYNRLDYWTNMAQTAERGLLDAIFIADVFGVYDVYGGSPETALRAGAQIPNMDPVVPVSAMAHVTKNIGFGITANLSFEHPFQMARRFSTLDHMTDGRIGWNIVTGYLESGARGMGQALQTEHDARYDVAEDFMAAIYKLWEASWEDGAALRDVAGGIFTDPAKVHAVHHDGPHFKVDGIQLSEPSPQRTPVLFQAGTSDRGRQFAARHAECVFINGPSQKIAAGTVTKLRDAVRTEDRNPADVTVFLGANVIIAPTHAEARDLHAEYTRHLDAAGQLALVSGWTGMDLSTLAPEDVVPFARSNAIQSTLENMTSKAPKPILACDLVALDATGARAPFFYGTASEVADQLLDWAEATGVDGFNLARLSVPATLDSIVDHLVPELQSRKRFKTRYAEGTLREKLGASSSRLPDTHGGR
ncbi:LLM class flavin-dependent oxidoreductase [Tianweitania populi]|uniref:Monooxygenase n=1 Tax=Tianweitania populi TaxID=1607949 RepID=A0A8J3GMI5_9HYPH|nr:LLM class flavin-dependent oxidoreductase [Tianweitania populi]GHD24633.1 monooxygenase [Tianweitania populi]